MKITVLVGNPKPRSRTLELSEALAAGIAREGDQITTIDLAEHTGQIFDWPSEIMTALSDQVAHSDLIVVASPTYKANYTGLLKSFLDRYPALGLRNVFAIPVMTGADKLHAMAPDVHLRSLLVELGAIVPTRGFYFETPHHDRSSQIVEEWIEHNALSLRLIRTTNVGVGRPGVVR